MYYVAAKGMATDGSSLSCRTPVEECPSSAVSCQATLRGQVQTTGVEAYTPLTGRIQVGREITGRFELQARVRIFAGGGTLLGKQQCGPQRGDEAKNICSGEVTGHTTFEDAIAGICTAKAGPLSNGFAAALDPPTNIQINYCTVEVTPKYSSCRRMGLREVTDPSHVTLATVAASSCRVRKGRPVKPLKHQRIPPPLKAPPPQPPLQLGPDCSRDDLSQPPAPGCVRVSVRVIPAPLPSDPGNESIGEGVGSATLQPGGKTIQCLNPADAPCVLSADVPANAPATVSAQPGSLSEDPSSPPDSAFWKFDGACTGTGACSFTPTNGATVDVYFIPAMVTLTLAASGDEGHANMTANEFEGGGLEPAGPVYCGYTYPSRPLPCKVMVRVEKFAQVEANTGGDPNTVLAGFSSNCTPSTQGPSFCELRMRSDQTVTALFATGAFG